MIFFKGELSFPLELRWGLAFAHHANYFVNMRRSARTQVNNGKASIKPTPINMVDCKDALASGWRAIPSRVLVTTLPLPSEAPRAANPAANPAAIAAAAWTSIGFPPFLLTMNL